MRRLCASNVAGAHRGLFPILIAGATLVLAPAAVRAANDPPWVVGKTGISPKAMTRTIENVSIDYHLVPGDNDAIRITVTGCGDSPWYITEGLDHTTVESMHETLDELFKNARLNCKLPEGIEQRFMAGFDSAFGTFKPTDPPHIATVAGWALEDKGSHPGDDSDRSVMLSKALPGISMIYRPSESGEGASIQLKFKPCKGLDASSGFDFGNPPEDHVKVVTEQVTESYADFTGDNKSCKTPPEPAAVLLQGFPEALATLEKWLKDKPFTYPPEPAPNDSSQTKEQ